jgi:nitrate/TMAO reductase-like tetraheme cytochrome c subunit
MKILKHGDAEIIRKLNNFVQFHCQTCHCIFEADYTEYTQTFRYSLTNVVEFGFYTATCPDCHKHVIEVMPDEKVQAYERERAQRNS